MKKSTIKVNIPIKTGQFYPVNYSETKKDGISRELFVQPYEKILITKRALGTFYQDVDNIQYHEGCSFLGYMPDGDSFLFSQGMGFDEKKEQRVIFCLSRNILKCVLDEYQDKKQM